MNGHNTEGVAAYGPGDEIELMAAILAAHDEEAVDPAWGAMMDDPICPVCGWTLIPVEDGRMICPRCGHEEAALDPATAAGLGRGDQWEEDELSYNDTVGEGLARWTR